MAHEKGVTVVVDNTFSPMIISPARLGADVVVHSCSKFISGGADIIAGMITQFLSDLDNFIRFYKLFMILVGNFTNFNLITLFATILFTKTLIILKPII